MDYWKEPEITAEDVKGPFLEESEFRIVFPDHRAKYIQEQWATMVALLGERHIKGELDLVNKTMSVSTTKKTYDPFAIIKARDFVKLVARGMALVHARTIFEDDKFCEVVKIGGVVRNKERFARRRQRLVGPNASTLKCLELLTKCHICICGQTVACIGPWKGVKRVRQIVLDCMNNIHPVYAIKKLTVERELAKNPEMKDADWTPYIPHFKKTKPLKKK